MSLESSDSDRFFIQKPGVEMLTWDKLRIAGVATVVAVGMLVTGCGAPDGDSDEIPPTRFVDSTGKTISVAQPSTTSNEAGSESIVDIEDGSNSGNGTDKDSLSSKTNLTKSMIPSVADLPEPRNMDEVASAIIKHVATNHPGMDVDMVEIIGNQLNNYSDKPGAVDSYWCSYLVKFVGGGRVGLEVTCSTYMLPCVSEKSLLRASDGNTYEVGTGKYLNDAEVEDKYPTQKSKPTYKRPNYNETREAPHTAVLVDDGHGHMVWVTQSGDAGTGI